MNGPFGWARFGNVGGGHRLIESRGVDEKILEQIRWHSDLPPQAVSGWSGFFAGYRKGDHYVVQRTVPDITAQRPGMVATSMSVHPIESLVDTSLTQLKTTIPASAGEFPANLPTGGFQSHAALGAAVDLLSSGHPAYWLGDALFDRALEELWDLLAPIDRSSLVFGLLFSPTSVPYPTGEDSLQIYLVPERLRPRFGDANVIDPALAPALSATSQAIFESNSVIGAQLEIATPTLREWRLLAATDGYLERIDQLSGDEARSCIHLLARLTTSADEGQQSKAAVTRHLAAITPGAPFAHLRGCRNLPLDRFQGLEIGDLVSVWSNEVLNDPNRTADLAAAVASLPEGQEFETLLGKALAVCASDGEFVIEHFVNLVNDNDRTTFRWLAHTIQSWEIDDALANALVNDTTHWVHAEAEVCRLAHTHAATCPTIDPIAAWEAHLSIETQRARSRSRLADRCPTKSIIEAALKFEDAHLTELAGSAALEAPELLEPATPVNPRWRAIWAAAVESGADPWQWIKPSEAVGPVFEALLDGEESLEQIAQNLARVEGVHVFDVPRRAELWARLQEPERSGVLKRTALAATLRGGLTTAMEAPLLSAVCTEANFRAAAALDVEAAIEALSRLAPSCEPDCARAIVESSSLDGHGPRFGRVISANRWTDVAKFVVASGRSDLGSVAQECRHLLSGLDRFLISFGSSGQPTPAEVSDGLLDLATTLYPAGPQERSLWERAGGRVADLEMSGTGREQWSIAIRSINAGASGTPALSNLLDGMVDDYQSNDSLRKLRGAV